MTCQIQGHLLRAEADSVCKQNLTAATNKIVFLSHISRERASLPPTTSARGAIYTGGVFTRDFEAFEAYLCVIENKARLKKAGRCLELGAFRAVRRGSSNPRETTLGPEFIRFKNGEAGTAAELMG